MGNAQGRIKHFLLSRLILLAAGLVVAMAVLRAFENRFIFFPPRYPEGFPPAGILPKDFEEIWLLTEDKVRLNALFLANSSTPKVLLWFHGNATNIGYQMDDFREYARLGVSILAVDYRGYGKSEGSPDEEGVYRDAEAAYRYLTTERHIQPENIIIYGHSLGGAVGVDLAARHPCGGLIVESSFTSAGDMARRMFGLPLSQYLPRNRFASLDKITRVHAPILVIHGTHDPTIPFSMGQRLFAAAPEPKSFLAVDGGDHDALSDYGGQKYWDTLREFMVLGPKRVKDQR